MKLEKCKKAEALIVGAGLTGSLTSRHLLGKVSGLSVWEKAECAGGRMYTHGQNLLGQPRIDLGAQVTKGGYSLGGRAIGQHFQMMTRWVKERVCYCSRMSDVLVL